MNHDSPIKPNLTLRPPNVNRQHGHLYRPLIHTLYCVLSISYDMHVV